MVADISYVPKLCHSILSNVQDASHCNAVHRFVLLVYLVELKDIGDFNQKKVLEFNSAVFVVHRWWCGTYIRSLLPLLTSIKLASCTGKERSTETDYQ